jgi:calmodulin
MMNDRDGSGSVSVEEAMQILYLRFGKGLLDTVIFKIVESLPLHHLILLCFAQQLEEIFGTSDTNSTKDLSLTEFLQSVTTSHVKQLRSKLAS